MCGLTKLQEVERQALVLDREAVIELVSAVREMRATIKKLLNSRCDAVDLTNFAWSAEAIENLEHETCISD